LNSYKTYKNIEFFTKNEHENTSPNINLIFFFSAIFFILLKYFFDRVRFPRLFASSARRKLNVVFSHSQHFHSQSAACAGKKIMLYYYVSLSLTLSHPEFSLSHSNSLICSASWMTYSLSHSDTVMRIIKKCTNKVALCAITYKFMRNVINVHLRTQVRAYEL
jgi:hypothetical protein